MAASMNSSVGMGTASKVTFALPSPPSALSQQSENMSSKTAPPKGERRRLESLVKAAAASSEGLPALLNPNATVDELLTNSGSAARALRSSGSGARTTSGSEIGLSLIDPGQAKAVEIYGFSLFLITWAALIAFVLWAYLPEGTLHAIGVSYFPDRYWALGAPAVLLMIVMFYGTMWGLYGMASNPHLDSFDSMLDGYSKHYQLLYPAAVAAGTRAVGATAAGSGSAPIAGTATGHASSELTSGGTAHHSLRWGHLAAQQSSRWQQNMLSPVATHHHHHHHHSHGYRHHSGDGQALHSADVASGPADTDTDGPPAFSGSSWSSWGYGGYRSRSASAGAGPFEGAAGGGLGPVSLAGFPLRPQPVASGADGSETSPNGSTAGAGALAASANNASASSNNNSRTPTATSPPLSPANNGGAGLGFGAAGRGAVGWSAEVVASNAGATRARPRGASCPPTHGAGPNVALPGTGAPSAAAALRANASTVDRRAAALMAAQVSPHRLFLPTSANASDRSRQQPGSAPHGLASHAGPSSSLLPSGVSKQMGTPDISDIPPTLVNRLQFLGPMVRRRITRVVKARAQKAAAAASAPLVGLHQLS